MSDDALLPADVRRDRIRERLDARGYVRVSEVAHDFGVSTVTARADVDALVDSGVARRVHGGAVATDARPESSFEESLAASASAKRTIGERAAALVSSGQSVFLDVGTTALSVARALAQRAELRDVVVITNGLNIALELEPEIPRFTVIVTGGALRPLQHSLVDPLARTLLQQVHADVAVLGCNGVDVEAGITNVNLPEAEVKAHMVEASDRVVIVADATKLGRVTLGRVCALDAVDALVTDAEADPAVVDELRAAGVAVEVAS